MPLSRPDAPARQPAVLASPVLEDNVMAFEDAIIGAAVFDLSGLPKEYYTTPSNQDVSWVQTIFQAIGLQSLLVASLQLESFRYAMIRCGEQQAIVVRQRACYTALLIQNESGEALSESLIHWSLEFEPSLLKSNPRFREV